MPRTAIVTPAYQPSELLIILITDIIKIYPTANILIINDGSDQTYQPIFDQLNQLNTTILTHPTNQGKGAALKTAFKHFLAQNQNTNTNLIGIVTADADGQHTANDILKILQQLEQSPNTLHLGTRQFNKQQIPLRSQIGNRFTRFIFSLTNKVQLQDTQSGLRGIPIQLIREIINSKTSAYDFELEMLLKAVALEIPIQETPIETIYVNNNATSHFKPLLDSAKIYYVFLRFAGISLISGAIDYVIFFTAYFLFRNILAALALGRIISGCFNYYFNKQFAFQANKNTKPTLLRYVLLAITLATILYFIIRVLHDHGYNIFISKVVAEILIYMFNFSIQRLFIFKQQKTTPVS